MTALTLLSYLILAILVSFLLAIPIISTLYYLRVTRRGEADFSNLIEKRKMKIGVPVMGGLIFIIPILILNTLFNLTPAVLVILLMVTLSALLGGLDDILNIYGYKRRLRALSKVNTLIKVHASYIVRLRLILMYPWYLYSRFFFMLGSNPGKGIHAHEKIIVQFIVGLVLALWLRANNATDIINAPFLGGLHIGILFIPFVVMTVILMTNAVNIADGLDGLSTSQLLASFTGFFVIAIDKQKWDVSLLLVITIGALLAYLYFNIPPARVQMGDVGSLSLGALLAACAFILNVPLLLLVIGLPFAITLTSTVIQGIGRRLLGRRVFLMAPIHHHFEMLGWSEEKVVMRFALFSSFCAIIGLWIYFADKLI
jgi:phospho-N-acetylmuramoyl-pentapeptide-transferase